MEEIANRFKEEYTELLSRYKEHLTNAQIMSILQSVTRKQIDIKGLGTKVLYPRQQLPLVQPFLRNRYNHQMTH